MNSDRGEVGDDDAGRLGDHLVDDGGEARVDGQVELTRELEHDDALRGGRGDALDRGLGMLGHGERGL